MSVGAEFSLGRRIHRLHRRAGEVETYASVQGSEVLRGRLPRVSHSSDVDDSSQGEKVIFFYDDDGKPAAGPESQIPSHLLPEDPEEYVAIRYVAYRLIPLTILY